MRYISPKASTEMVSRKDEAWHAVARLEVPRLAPQEEGHGPVDARAALVPPHPALVEEERDVHTRHARLNHLRAPV